MRQLYVMKNVQFGDLHTAVLASESSKVFGISAEDYSVTRLRAALLEEALFGTCSPRHLLEQLDHTLFAESLANPSDGLTPDHIRLLIADSVTRYSFLCNSTIAIAKCRDTKRLAELSVLCAEAAAGCSQMGAEFLGVFDALCCAPIRECGFPHVVEAVNAADFVAVDNLATLARTLSARGCFRPLILFNNIILESLRAAIEERSLLRCRAAHFACLLLLGTLAPMGSDASAILIDSPVIRLPRSAVKQISLREAIGFCLNALYRLASTQSDVGEPSTTIEESFASLAGLIFVRLCSEQWIKERFSRDSSFLHALFRDLTDAQAEQLCHFVCEPRNLLTTMHSREHDMFFEFS